MASVIGEGEKKEREEAISLLKNQIEIEGQLIDQYH